MFGIFAQAQITSSFWLEHNNSDDDDDDDNDINKNESSLRDRSRVRKLMFKSHYLAVWPWTS